MDDLFPENEKLYRAVYPPEFNQIFWKDEKHVSSAAFLDKRGLSVERGNFRSDNIVVKEMKKSFIGKIIFVTVQCCLGIKAIVVYRPTRRSSYHSEIHGNKNSVVLSPSQRRFLACNSKLIAIDALFI